MLTFRSERDPAVGVARLRDADLRVLRFLRTRGHSPAVERAVGRFSALGEHGGLWLAIGAAGAALDGERRAQWLRASGTVAGVYALNTAIKLVVRRRRPVLEGLPPLAKTPTQLSFPSSHAATAFAGAAGYSRLGAPATPLYALALATAVSRPYLGLHYPSDVVAGAGLGLGAGRLGAGRLGAGRLRAGSLGAGRLGAGRLRAGSLGASRLRAGRLGAGRLGGGGAR